MMIFTDGSAQQNPGPTGSGVVIKIRGPNSVPVKIATAISPNRVQALQVKYRLLELVPIILLNTLIKTQTYQFILILNQLSRQ